MRTGQNTETKWRRNPRLSEKEEPNAMKLMKKLEKIIKKAALKHVTKKKVDNRVKPGLTPGIKETIKKRNQLRKTVSTNRKEWLEACNDVREMIKGN